MNSGQGSRAFETGGVWNKVVGDQGKNLVHFSRKERSSEQDL